MLLSISWKNIWRNKVRSLIVVFAIAIGLSGGLIIASLFNGIIEERVRAAIEDEVSNIQIHQPAFLLEKEVEDTIPLAKSIMNDIATYPQVKALSARIKITGMASTATKGTGVTIMGIDPQNEKLVTGLYRYIPDSMGTFFGEQKRNCIVIGKKLADNLKVRLKSKIILNIQTDSGMVTQAAFKVSGIFKTNNSVFDQNNVLVRACDLMEIMGYKSFKAHEIAINLKNDSTNNTLTRKINHQYPRSLPNRGKKFCLN